MALAWFLGAVAEATLGGLILGMILRKWGRNQGSLTNRSNMPLGKMGGKREGVL